MFRISIGALILSNLIPLFGVLFFDGRYSVSSKRAYEIFKGSKKMRILHMIVCLSLAMLVVSPLTSLHPERTMKISQQTPTLFDWENPAVVGRNKEPAHCTYIPYSDIQTALKNEPSRSSFYKSLNGLWKFNFVKKPSDRPVNFYKDDYDVSQWHDISVPGNWELQGFGVPVYTDTEYPFSSDPPQIPHDDNPVGSYRRIFTVPESWFDQQVFLHFGSVKSAMYVWVNGMQVGYSQGSKTPAEFNITQYLRQGENSSRARTTGKSAVSSEMSTCFRLRTYTFEIFLSCPSWMKDTRMRH
jgi:beta-galactosidase